MGEPEADQAPGATLAIILVSWNTEALLKQCLASVLATHAGREARIVVVDNASSDGSVVMLRRDFPGVEVIENAENLGFGAANNQGAERAGPCRYLLLLNTDTTVPAGALEALVAYLEANPEVGIVGPRLVGDDGQPQRSCRTFPSLRNLFLEASGLSRVFGRPEMSWFALDRTIGVDYVQGACMLIRRDLWDRLRGFDTDYFFYAEDADLCRRARDEDFRTVFLHEVEVVHYGGRSAEQVKVATAIEGFRSTLLFIRKHDGRLRAALGRVVALCGALARALVTTLALPALALLGRGRQGFVALRTYAAVARALTRGDMRPRPRRW